MEELKNVIERVVADLICETHPSVCNLRDTNYKKLEKLILAELMNAETTISVQTAIARLEIEL